MLEKGQNYKTPAKPVTVATYWKSERNSHLEGGHNTKMAIFGQKVPKKGRFPVRRVPFDKILQIWDQILKALNILFSEMALVWLKSQKCENQPKKAKKGQNYKTAATPVTVSSHWKSERNAHLLESPNPKLAIFDQKVPKKCRFALGRAPFGKILQIRDQIPKALNILCWEMALVFGFGAKFKKRHFCAEKIPFFPFGWYLPFSMAFFSPQTSLFAPNFQNQVRKPDFGRYIPLRLGTLQKAMKNQQTVLPDTFFQSDSFQHTNLVQTTYWPSLETFHQ